MMRTVEAADVEEFLRWLDQRGPATLTVQELWALLGEWLVERARP